jgi:hypothetical protein
MELAWLYGYHFFSLDHILNKQFRATQQAAHLNRSNTSTPLLLLFLDCWLTMVRQQES